MIQVRRVALGAAIGLAGIAACFAVMMPFRQHLSTATTALVLVIPVVAGVALGGFLAGALVALVGFLTYDLAFIKPYGTLTVGAAQNWTALFVYLIVVLLVARLVSYLQLARAEARRREAEARRLYRLAERLIAERPLTELLVEVVETVVDAFGPRWAAMLLPGPEGLELVATAGAELTAEEQRSISADPRRPQSLAVSSPAQASIAKVALYVQDHPVGLLVLSDVGLAPADRELLRVYAGQAAQAIERSQLRDAALRSEMLEEADRWRRALLGAVSHDLRTPLATIKAAVSAVRDSGRSLNTGQREELLSLIEAQSDDLARLVTNLLDLTRIQSGALQLRREPTAVEDIVVAAANALGPSAGEVPIATSLPAGLPPVDVDELLMVQVVANLLENAARHAPPKSAVEVSAREDGGVVTLTVRDRGPGVPPAERERIFEMWATSDRGGRAGLGLGIARAFVEAHHQSISYLDAEEGGALFAVTMAVALVPAAVGGLG